MDLYKGAIEDGQWFPFGPKDEDGQTEFLIAALPVSEERELSRKHFGKKRQLVVSKDGQRVIDSDVEKNDAFAIEKAVRCLKESRKAYMTLNARTAQLFGPLVQGCPGAGERLVFDGRWTPEVKEALLTDVLPTLAGWVIDKADGLRRTKSEEEADLAKT